MCERPRGRAGRARCTPKPRVAEEGTASRGEERDDNDHMAVGSQQRQWIKGRKSSTMGIKESGLSERRAHTQHTHTHTSIMSHTGLCASYRTGHRPLLAEAHREAAEAQGRRSHAMWGRCRGRRRSRAACITASLTLFDIAAAKGVATRTSYDQHPCRVVFPRLVLIPAGRSGAARGHLPPFIASSHISATAPWRSTPYSAISSTSTPHIRLCIGLEEHCLLFRGGGSSGNRSLATIMSWSVETQT